MDLTSFISNAFYLFVVQQCTGQVLLRQNTLHVIHMWLFMNLATEQWRVISPVDPVSNYGQLDEVLRIAQLFMNLPRSCTAYRALFSEARIGWYTKMITPLFSTCVRILWTYKDRNLDRTELRSCVNLLSFSLSQWRVNIEKWYPEYLIPEYMLWAD